MLIRDYYERRKKLVALPAVGLVALLTGGWVVRARAMGPKHLRASELTGR